MRIEIKLQAAFLIHALYYHKIIFLKYKSNYGAHLFIKTFSLTQCLLKKFHTPFPAVYSLQPTFPDSQATIPLSYLDRTVWTNIASTSYLLCPTQRQLVTLYMFCSLCIYSLRVTILYYIHFFFFSVSCPHLLRLWSTWRPTLYIIASLYLPQVYNTALGI